ncbi:cytochrome b/b6 domain-containing protein [Demequina iriomotensis]|uniref:cytochrome b/b6 domain-containing protein n=1 Tax=Demequina iriomotensis TaxID=1536641 RepID=UPI0009E5A7A6|nr:cytochrome b/b6 domain-containing protein [Demequina iriomotensis]
MTRIVRRGLPRVPGGEPWPPAREVVSAVDDARFGAAAPVTAAVVIEEAPAPSVPTPATVVLSEVPLRRGLPRVEGGEPWPAEGFAPARFGVPAEVVTTAAAPAEAPAAIEAPAVAFSDVPLRRGLPRVEGGEPWPPAGFAPAWAVVVAPDSAPEAVAPEAEPVTALAEAPASSPAPDPIPTPRRMGRGGRIAVALIALLAVVAAVVLVARWLVTLDGVQGFLADYPGTYALPEDAPVGIPAWLSWQHFFNVFLIVLIARTGLMVRRQQRPEAYWAPRSDPKDRSSLMSWTHQALDIFWVVNGAVYLVLLFATGQWMRIVPTSWDVFPNAVSAVLQYLSLDFPAHDSWAYYNSLQQIFYFLAVFVAAPLAIATGVRMSMYWRGGARWDRVYPKSVARALHFPVMIYFVAFVVGHVALVLTTGARANLQHMYAASDGGGWLGVVMFVISLVVIAGASFALRPLFLAPVAGRFGSVTSR